MSQSNPIERFLNLRATQHQTLYETSLKKHVSHKPELCPDRLKSVGKYFSGYASIERCLREICSELYEIKSEYRQALLPKLNVDQCVSLIEDALSQGFGSTSEAWNNDWKEVQQQLEPAKKVRNVLAHAMSVKTGFRYQAYGQNQAKFLKCSSEALERAAEKLDQLDSICRMLLWYLLSGQTYRETKS